MKLCYDSNSNTDKEKNHLSLKQFVKKIQYTGNVHVSATKLHVFKISVKNIERVININYFENSCQMYTKRIRAIFSVTPSGRKWESAFDCTHQQCSTIFPKG